MDRPLSVLLVEDDPDEREQFDLYIGLTEEVQLVGETGSAVRALEYVSECSPDAIILDLELHKGSGSGISFLKALGGARVVPYILVTTNNVSPITHEQVRRLGADFIMLKSQADYCAESVIGFLLTLKGVIQDSRGKRRDMGEALYGESKNGISTQLSVEIDLVGISPKAIGRCYLMEAILMLIEGRTRNYIADIARKYGKTDASVERAMQNAINRAWRTYDIEELQRYYVARISSDKGVPTLTEFIFYYANKMKSK